MTSVLRLCLWPGSKFSSAILSAAERDSEMKVAEALALRSDLQKRLEQLKQRLVKNARIQEGDAPEEDPAELQSEFEKSAQELTSLIQRINRTNAAENQYMVFASVCKQLMAVRYWQAAEKKDVIN